MEPFVELGKAAPGPASLDNLYTCPNRKNALLKAIVISNRQDAETKVRVSLSYAGTQITPADWIFYDAPLYENDTIVFSNEGEGIPIGPDMQIKCYSLSGNVTFKALGTETYLKPPT